jgi:hypothetical protein
MASAYQLSAESWKLIQELTLNEEDGNIVSDYNVSSEVMKVAI